MANYIRIIRGFSPSVRAYILANAAVGFAYFGIANVIYNLFLLRLGYDLALIGRVNGVGQLSWALMALPASLIGRRFGLRRMMIGGSLIITFGYILFLLITRLPADIRVAWLFATTILTWIGAALVTVNGLPLISSVTRAEERSHALAMTNAASSFMAIFGVLVADFLVCPTIFYLSGLFLRTDDSLRVGREPNRNPASRAGSHADLPVFWRCHLFTDR